jgi:hypothetical protein
MNNAFKIAVTTEDSRDPSESIKVLPEDQEKLNAIYDEIKKGAMTDFENVTKLVDSFSFSSEGVKKHFIDVLYFLFEKGDLLNPENSVDGSKGNLLTLVRARISTFTRNSAD